jgi:molybdopterin molybdotransferase
VEQVISFEEALDTVDRVLADWLAEAEAVAVRDAQGRVLAEDAVSRLDLPPFHKSAVDGYALMEGDEREEYRVIEQVPAGRTPTCPLSPGQATKVMTGAPVPEGAGRVVMIEHTEERGSIVRVLRHGGQPNIRQRGEDAHVGQTVLCRGSRLGALTVANLVACGIASVQVRRPVRVAIVSTGDELVDRFEEITPGKIMDCNGPMLAGLARENDLPVVFGAVARDEPEELTEALQAAAARADVTVVSGGVSVGELDLVPMALTKAGFTIHFDRVAMQPGKPLTFATRDRRAAIGLPGNPVSVFVGFHLFVLRAVARISGSAPPARPFAVAVRKEVRLRSSERTALLPCVLDPDGSAEVVAYHGSADLLAVSRADGFLRIPQGVDHLEAGSKALFYPLMWRGA